MSEQIGADEARDALAEVGRARDAVVAEIGLPRAYWWGMAGGWVLLGVVGSLGPMWLSAMVTAAFGVAHATVASRLLDGRRRSRALRVSAEVAGHRTPLVVIGMLLGLIALTVGAALLLDADGADHAAIWAGVWVAAIVGFGGPEILRTLRRMAHA